MKSTSLLPIASCTLLAGLSAQDSDGDGLPDHLDSCPRVVYSPGFDWRTCPGMDLNPHNDSQPECKARERVAAFLVGQPSYATQIAFSVVKNGRVHFADAFTRTGRNFHHDPAGIHRLFRIGSTTKAMTAVAAKILEEQGRLSLSDWVSDDDATRVPSSGKRTLRHLLTHRGCFRLDSGAIHLFCFPGDLLAFWRLADDRISPHYDSARYGNLGGGYEYSAFNYSLAGAYLTQRSGQTFAALLQSLIFDPSTMCSASVDGPRANLAPIGGTVGTTRTSSMHTGPYINLVAPTDPHCADNFYSSNDVYGQSSYVQQSYRLDECSAEARDPAGGVMASVVDMAHFARMLLASYHGTGGLLSPQGIRDLWTPSHDFGCGTSCPYQRYYGVGFFVADASGPVTEVEHGGSRAGYHSVFVVRPEARLAVSILVNAHVDLGAMNRVAKAILDDFDQPVPGHWRSYGQGCPGSVTQQKTCASLNTGGQELRASTGANRSYAIPVTTAAPLDITGFELHTEGGQTVRTFLLADDGNGQPGAVLATGAMTVGPMRGWYSTRFDRTVRVAAGQRVYLSFTNGPTPILASLKTGTRVPYFFRGSGSWFQGAANWTYRVRCHEGTPATPRLSHLGTPVVGESLTITLRDAAPSSSVLLFLGGSNTAWNALSLPFDLGAFGATGCQLLAAGHVVLPLVTDSSGIALLPGSIPNVRSIAGTQLYLQAGVLDRLANPFGLVVSAGADVQLGRQ